MGKYKVQWWYFSAMKWMSVDKSFIFQRRAEKYVAKRVINKKYASKWRIIDTAYAAPVTRVVCRVERVKEGEINE